MPSAVEPSDTTRQKLHSETPRRHGPRSFGALFIFVGVVQSILFFAHWAVYETWTSFHAVADPPGITTLQAVLFLLSVSFVAASLLVHRYSNTFVHFLYEAAAVWLGLLNFLFVAAFSSWVIYLAGRGLGFRLDRPAIANFAFGLAALTAVYGMLNARRIQVRKVAVRLPNLPAAWRGRLAALVSDIHLGPINGARFLRRIVSRITRLQPDIVFIVGDLFDGNKVKVDELTSPWKGLSASLGSYFVTGNHEEFSNPAAYLQAIADSGVRVLNNEKVIVDGLQVVGVNDRDLSNPERLRNLLEAADLTPRQPSILLAHTPNRLDVAEKAGISLQLSGHTHGGQIFPFTWFTRKIFGEHTYGLKRFGELITYTSSGAGTWGPPMRVGTSPEIVLIEFA